MIKYPVLLFLIYGNICSPIITGFSRATSCILHQEKELFACITKSNGSGPANKFWKEMQHLDNHESVPVRIPHRRKETWICPGENVYFPSFNTR